MWSQVTNSMQQNPSWKASSSSASAHQSNIICIVLSYTNLRKKASTSKHRFTAQEMVQNANFDFLIIQILYLNF
jgi:hypothetical protein